MTELSGLDMVHALSAALQESGDEKLAAMIDAQQPEVALLLEQAIPTLQAKEAALADSNAKLAQAEKRLTEVSQHLQIMERWQALMDDFIKDSQKQRIVDLLIFHSLRQKNPQEKADLLLAALELPAQLAEERSQQHNRLFLEGWLQKWTHIYTPENGFQLRGDSLTRCNSVPINDLS